MSNFGNLDCPATGISIGLDRLIFALMQKKDFKIKATRPIIICVFDKNKIKDLYSHMLKTDDQRYGVMLYKFIYLSSWLKKRQKYMDI